MDVLQTLSVIVNIFNIIQIYLMKSFLSGQMQLEAFKSSEVQFIGFKHWYKVCSSIYEMRKLFWLVAFVVVGILFLISCSLISAIYLFYRYER